MNVKLLVRFEISWNMFGGDKYQGKLEIKMAFILFSLKYFSNFFLVGSTVLEYVKKIR